MRFRFSTGVPLLIYLEFRVKTCCAYLLMEIATCFSEYKNRHRHIYSLSCHKVLIGFVFVAKIVKKMIYESVLHLFKSCISAFVGVARHCYFLILSVLATHGAGNGLTLIVYML